MRTLEYPLIRDECRPDNLTPPNRCLPVGQTGRAHRKPTDTQED